MAKELRIRDEQNNLLYPVTVTDLVFDDQTGENLTEQLEGKQETLESGTNIKTINGNSILGSGNIEIVGQKGEKGDTGSVTVSDGVAQITIVNDLITGGTGDALSAEMGKRLGLEVSGISKRFNTSVARLLAAVLRKVAYIDTSVQDSANELIAILDAQASVLSISATYIGGQKYTGDTISVNDFAVVATYDDNTSGSVTATSVSPTRPRVRLPAAMLPAV